MRRHIAPAVISLLLLLNSACSSSSGKSEAGAPEPAAGAKLAVDNRSTQDMDIYIRGATGGATRLGLAPASDTTVFSLATALIVGAKTLRFEGRPTGGGQPVLSDPFDVRPGDEIDWSIPPQ